MRDRSGSSVISEEQEFSEALNNIGRRRMMTFAKEKRVQFMIDLLLFFCKRTYNKEVDKIKVE